MKVVRRILYALLVVATLVVGAAAAAVIVSQTAWFKNWLRGYIVQEANQYLNGELTVERLAGNLFFGVELENIAVSMDGEQVVAVQDLGVDYNVFDLVSKGLAIDRIRLNKPTIYLRRQGDTWSIARLIKSQAEEADREGPASPMSIGEIGISDAAIVIDDPAGIEGVDVPDRIERIDASLAFRYEPVHYTITVSHVSFRAAQPAIGLNALSGVIAVRDDAVHLENVAIRTEETSLLVAGAVRNYLTTPAFQLRVSSDKLSIPEIARVVPALAGIELQPAFEIEADGPMDSLGLTMNVRSQAGQVTGTMRSDLVAPGQSVQGELAIRHLDLAAFPQSASLKTDLAADLKVDLQADAFAELDSLRGTASVRSPRLAIAGYAAEQVRADARVDCRKVGFDAGAAAYGARVTATGAATLPKGGEAIPYEATGRIQDVDIRRLPPVLALPRVATDVSAAYRVRGSEPGRDGGIRKVAAEARLSPSVVGSTRIADGSLVSATMSGSDLEYGVDATLTGIDLARIGADFAVPALADAKYATDLNAQITAGGRGTRPAEMTVWATGRLHDSTLLGGRIPELTFAASLVEDAAHVEATGEIADLDPAVASGRPEAKGQVGGTLNVVADVEAVSSGQPLDSLRASALVNLMPSSIGGLAIERAAVDADYHRNVGDIRTAEIVGRDLNVTASGRLALDEDGASNLVFHVDSPSLAELGKLAAVPIEGIAKVDGTITGNRSSLHAAGTLVGNGVKSGENGALGLTADYTATIPELDVERASVAADLEATFVSVAGQNINVVAGKTTYANRRVEFELQAKQPERTVEGGGAVTLHPDHQEIHLDRLAFDTRGVRWQLAPGGDATIEYGKDVVTLRGVQLVSGGQQITAAGSFGQPGDALKVSMSQVDLAGVDALLLREPQLTGRLDAEAAIGGTAKAPEVTATFEINSGGFRQFRYDTFSGTVGYAGTGVTVDARLQQNPTQWLTARGYLPMALFSDPARRTPEAAREQVDLMIDSSPIDFGVVQGFTEALTDVRGTLEAHVKVTGPAADPRPEGAVTLRDAALRVEPTGVRYRNIAADVELQPDRVRIREFTVLDDRESAISVSGDLAIGDRKVDAVQLYVTGHDLKVIDNEMGNVRVQASLEISGDVKAPHVGGYFGITTGQLELDAIIAMLGASPYPTEAAPGDEAAPAADEPPAPGVFDALTMDVHVTVPNALLVRANSLQTPGTPISLGALNLTLGGDLQATKKQGDSLRLVGTVNTVRGNYDFQGRRFEILRDGLLRFEGLDELNPSLDLRTRRVISGVEANVNVRGTLQQPEIVLTSTPPLEPADILALIVFNQPLNQLGEGQQVSLAQRAQSLATGAVAGQLAKSIGNALNLDMFEINLAPESGGGPELTVGQQVGQNLYVRVQQGIGEQSMTNFILEYELTEWLRLQTNVMQGSSTQQSLFRRAQGSGADLIFFFSY